MKRQLVLVGLGAVTALALGLFAQEGPGPEGGGGATPGGSDFSTQFNDGGALGGAGPGMTGEVLTSNGAGMAPSFQAGGGGGGCTPSGSAGEILYDDGAGACDNEAALNYDAGTDTLEVPNATITTSLVASAAGSVEDLEVGDELTLAGDAGTSGDVLTSSGMGMAPTWQSSSGVAQSTGSFVASFDDACTTTPTQTFNFVLTGSMVTLRSTGNIAACTSDSTVFATTGAPVPAGLRPAADITVQGFLCQNAGVSIACGLKISTAGNVSYCVSGASGLPTCAATNWTASGNKVQTITNAQSTVTYPLT